MSREKENGETEGELEMSGEGDECEREDENLCKT